MILKKQITLLFCLVIHLTLCHFSLFGQTANAFAQLKEINDYSRNQKSCAFNVQYAIYANYTNTKAESNTYSIYIKQNDIILNKGEQTIIYQNTECLIMVNLIEKKIYLANPVKDILKSASLQDIEKTLTKGSDLQVAEKDKQKVFTVSFKSTASEYEKIIINVDKKTSNIQKYTMYMREEMKIRYEDPSCKSEKPRMEVNITPSASLIQEFSALLKESYFIQKSRDSYAPSAEFKGFKVINNIIK